MFVPSNTCPYPPLTKRVAKCEGVPYEGDVSKSEFDQYVNKLIYWAEIAQDAYIFAINPPDPLPEGFTLKAPRKSIYSPFYFVYDTYERLIISLKGTSTVADTIADLAIAKNLQEIRGGIMVHSAMLRAAETLLEIDGLLEKHILPAIEAGKKIRLVGHSLGAGTLIYMILLLLADPRIDMPNAQIYGYAFAPPSVLPRCSSDDVAPYIMSIVNANDTVCRLPPLKNLILPGGSNIVHMVECKGEIKMYLRDWSWFKSDKLGIDTNRKDHYLKSYIRSLEQLKQSEALI